MAGSKSTLTRLVGIITDKMHLTTIFSSNMVSVYEKACRDASCPLLSLPVLFVYFFVQTLLNYFFSFLVAIYTC